MAADPGPGPTKDAPLVTSDSTKEFKDISSEIFRVYQFVREGLVVPIQITAPIRLHEGKSGEHRVLTEDGLSIYVPAGWISLMWRPKEGKPAFEF